MHWQSRSVDCMQWHPSCTVRARALSHFLVVLSRPCSPFDFRSIHPFTTAATATAAPFNQFFLYPSIHLSILPFPAPPSLPSFLGVGPPFLGSVPVAAAASGFPLRRRQETNRPPRAVPPLGGRARVRICGGGGREEGERTARIEKAAVVKGKPGGEPRRHRVVLW